jgi:probable HAF family extracellular repeat protein
MSGLARTMVLAMGSAAILLSGRGALGQSLTGMGHLSGDNASQALGVSADGSVVVGIGGTDGGYVHALRWTREAGVDNIAPASSFAHAHAVSGDGSVIVGIGDPDGAGSGAFRWTNATGMVRLDTTGTTGTDAYAVNADGSVVSGYIIVGDGKRAAIWTNAGVGGGVVHNLGTLSTSSGPGDYHCGGPGQFPAFSQGYGGISADGTIVSGDGSANVQYCSGHVFRWVSDGAGGGTLTDLGHLPGQYATDSLAFGISGDGLVVVGQSQASNNDQAYRWSAATGMVDIGFALTQGNDLSQGNAANSDGSVVVGWFYSEVAGDTHALLWTTARGSEDFQDYLAGLGVDLTGWVLQDATAISADGLTIVGYGDHNGLTEGWIADLHPACGTADFNCDGDVGTDSDIEAFFLCLSGTCPLPPCTSNADFNGDGDVGTDADIESFFRVLGGGPC